MDIAIVAGSVRIGRQSHKVAYYLEKELEKRGLNVDLIDLAVDALPVFQERVHCHPEPPEQAKTIGARLHRADALILVTPEYHGSFSGVLKNMLDYFRSEFQKKAFGVVATSSGMLGGINASTQLQHVILSVGGYPIPQKLLVPEIHVAFNDSFEPQNQKIERSSAKFIDEFLWFADALNRKKWMEKDTSIQHGETSL